MSYFVAAEQQGAFAHADQAQRLRIGQLRFRNAAPVVLYFKHQPAALFLERFVADTQAWGHVDVYAWNDADRPGKPAGGEAQGLRAAFELLKSRAA